MNKFIAAAVLSLAIAAPALAPAAMAYGARPVEAFDAAAELRRATGSAQFPESGGGFVREARPLQPGSEAMPRPTAGIPHSGVDMLVGGSSRYPVLSNDHLSHPSTGLSQDQVMTEDFDG